MYNRKSGVSLVTVLLFMMVATIAVTSTYRWVSSSNMSSASRMKLNAARELATSGIEATRSWITFNGNDAGSLVKQFYDGHENPILLNPVLPKNFTSSNKDSVWLVGVSQDRQNIRLKILSVGTLDENTKFSEIAILNVSGLFQASLPLVEKTVNYAESFNGVLGAADSVIVDAAVIKQTPEYTKNGVQMINGLKSSKYVIMDGSFYVNHTADVHDLYVTGDLDFGYNVNVSGNMYVGGDFYGSTTSNTVYVGKSAYIKGDFKPEEKSEYVKNNVSSYSGSTLGGKFTIGSNLTVNGNLHHFKKDYGSKIQVDSNLVVHGQLKINSGATARDTIRVYNNAYIHGYSLASGSEIPLNRVLRTYIGTLNNSNKLYVGNMRKYENAFACDDNGYKCAETMDGSTFYVAYQGNFSTAISDDEIHTWEADTLADYSSLLKERNTECSIAQSPIQFNEDLLQSDLLVSSYEKRGCDERIWSKTDDYVDLINNCYDVALTNGTLYNNNWLLLEFESLPQWEPTDKKIEKNVIMIVHGNTVPTNGFTLPQTTQDANVVLYLPEGWNNTTEGAGIKMTKNDEDTYYRYFVYSAGDIGSMTSQNKAKGISGSVFMEGCSVFNSLKTSARLVSTFDQTMVDMLASASVICNYDGTKACSPYSGIASGYVGGTVYSSVDEYYISTAPQLSVSIETQYRNNENISRNASDFSAIKPSGIVLPRIVYLSQDPVGRLSDYYNVMGLNGSKQSKVAAKMTCPYPLNSSSEDALLYDGSSLLAEGKYICTYEEAENRESIPLFVVVEGLVNETPDVMFEKERVPISAGNSVLVSLKGPTDVFSVFVTAPASMPGGWENLELQPGVTEVGEADGFKTYKVLLSGSSDPMPIFRVTAGEYAEVAEVRFQLGTPCTGCKIGKPDISTVYISNRVTVERRDFYLSFCNDITRANSFKEQYGVSCEEAVNSPNCEKVSDNVEWVRAKGCFYSEGEKNNKWNCNIDVDKVWLEDLIPNNKDCEAYIPDSTVVLNTNTNVYYLPAMLKRKKTSFHLKFVGPSGDEGVNINVRRSGSDGKDTVCYNDCSVSVYMNDTVYTARRREGSGKFSYWACDGVDCGEYGKHSNTDSLSKLIVTDQDTILYHFNEKDTSCFYTDFSKTKDNGWCTTERDDDNECVDYCYSGDQCKISEGHATRKGLRADWFVPIKNKEGKWSLFNSEIKADEFRKPEIKRGQMTAPDGFSVKLLRDYGYHPTVVLNTARAGYNGQMTALFEVPTGTSQAISKLMNGTIDDGFIFRSNDNASQYFLLSIVSGLEGTASFHTRAKICRTGGLDGNSSAPCDTASFKTGLIGSSNVFESKLGRSSLNVDIKDNIVTITLSHSVFSSEEYRPAIAQIDLNKKFSDNLYNDDDHSRVGVKLAVPGAISNFLDELGQIFNIENVSMEFAVYDLGWKSYTYGSSCWDTPSVSCSFRANYAGGMVPKDSLVSPWVAMSSWFDGKDCEVRYFYNGCDLDESRFKADARLLGLSIAYGSNEQSCKLTEFVTGEARGFYMWHARQLDNYNRGVLIDSNYMFRDEGYHGYDYNGLLGNGTMKEASVLVHCKGTSDMNVHVYDASCGDFLVGTFEECSESYAELLARDQICHDGGDLCIPAWNVVDPINVRDAEIRFTVNNLTSGSVEVYLVSNENILSSKALTITASGDYTFDVAAVSNEAGFNPQKVKGLAFRSSGTNGFYVTHVQSYCKYAFGLTCKPTAYDAMNKQWVVGADVLHSEKADKCQVVALNGRVPTSSIPAARSCANFEQNIPQGDVFGQDVEENYAFRVIALDAQGNALDSCETEPYTAPAFNLTCELSKQAIEQGYGLPSFTYSMSGCPEGGCSYTLKFPNDSTAAKKGESGSAVCPEGGCRNYNVVNSSRDDKWSKGTYSYNVEVLGHSCVAGNEFEILSEPPKATCQDSKGRIEGGKFIADVVYDTKEYSRWKGSFNVTVSGNFIVADPLGNVLINEEVDSDNPHYEKAMPESMASCKKGWCKYVAVLKLYGGELCPAEWISFAPMGDLNCPAEGSLTDKSPSEEITLLENSCNDDKNVDCLAVPDCKDGNCFWKVTRGFTDIDYAENYTGSVLAFSGDNGAVGKRSYRLTVNRIDHDDVNDSRDTVQKYCDFDVVYNNSALSTQCHFESPEVEWGASAKIGLASNCANCPYKIFSPSGKEKASGTTSAIIDEYIYNEFEALEQGEYKVVVNGATESPCLTSLSMAPIGKIECTPKDKSLAPGKSSSMTATIPCKTSGCNWNWELEKSDGTRTTGTTGSNVNINVPGSGSYKFYVNGEQVCTFEIEKGKDCYFDKDEYEYGADFKFIISSLSINANSSCSDGWFSSHKCWEWTFSGGGLSLEGDESSTYSNKLYTVSGSGIKKSGPYTFKAGTYSCAAEAVVKSATIECKRKKKTECTRKDRKGNCTREETSYSLSLTATGCNNGGCTYVVYGESKDSPAQSITTTDTFTGFKSGRTTYTVDGTTSYSVSINGGDRVSCVNDY